MNSWVKNPATRNRLALGCLACICVMMLIAYQRGSDQEQLFLQDRQYYYTAIQATNQQDYKSSLKYLEMLSPAFKQSWMYFFAVGLSDFQAGQIQAADESLQKAEDMRPVFLITPEYLVLRARVFVQLGNKDQADLYLNQALKVARDDAQRKEIGDYIQQVKTMK